MKLDPNLIPILACPVCKGPLVSKPSLPDALVCQADRLVFPINNGIPVLIEEEAIAWDGSE